jgi:hypothetical protein
MSTSSNFVQSRPHSQGLPPEPIQRIPMEIAFSDISNSFFLRSVPARPTIGTAFELVPRTAIPTCAPSITLIMLRKYCKSCAFPAASCPMPWIFWTAARGCPFRGCTAAGPLLPHLPWSDRPKSNCPLTVAWQMANGARSINPLCMYHRAPYHYSANQSILRTTRLHMGVDGSAHHLGLTPDRLTLNGTPVRLHQTRIHREIGKQTIRAAHPDSFRVIQVPNETRRTRTKDAGPSVVHSRVYA